MKVLMQEWHSEDKGHLISISKDRAQLDATISKLKSRELKDEECAEEEEDWDEDRDGEEKIDIYGEAEEIEIPDDSVFASMVENQTVFLLPDELDIIYDALNKLNSE